MERDSMYRRWGKRCFDVIASLLLLVLLAPLLTLLALLVRVFLGGPVLFRQVRSGKNRQAFTIVKFRTMTDARDAAGALLPDGERLTRLGRFLRATSLDELPELWNVLKGDMSLVGPRPLLRQYDAYYSERELRRFDLLPGITGWAQINGRNEVAWDQRLEFDAYYADHHGFWFDMKILCLTVVKVVRRDNVHVDTDRAETAMDEERRQRAATI
jgi:lipopolysaccharide/colanic/teichoic acid biosynthesis glycosyltransferase